MTLARYLRAARERQGIGLRELAERVGVSPARLSRIERGDKSAPSVRLCDDLARELKLDADEVFRLAWRVPPDVHEWLLKPGNVAKVRRLMGR